MIGIFNRLDHCPAGVAELKLLAVMAEPPGKIAQRRDVRAVVRHKGFSIAADYQIGAVGQLGVGREFKLDSFGERPPG